MEDYALMCPHPTASVRYYHEIDDEGRDYEEWCCLACNCWLSPAEAQDYHLRPDWEEDIPLDS